MSTETTETYTFFGAIGYILRKSIAPVFFISWVGMMGFFPLYGTTKDTLGSTVEYDILHVEKDPDIKTLYVIDLVYYERSPYDFWFDRPYGPGKVYRIDIRKEGTHRVRDGFGDPAPEGLGIYGPEDHFKNRIKNWLRAH